MAPSPFGEHRVGERLRHRGEGVALRGEVGLALELDHRAGVVGDRHRHRALCVVPLRTGRGLDDALLAQPLRGRFHVAVIGLEGPLGVHHPRTRAVAEGLDVLRGELGHSQDSSVDSVEGSVDGSVGLRPWARRWIRCRTWRPETTPLLAELSSGVVAAAVSSGAVGAAVRAAMRASRSCACSAACRRASACCAAIRASSSAVREGAGPPEVPPPRRDAMKRPSSTASAMMRHIKVPARMASSLPGITYWIRSGIAVRVDDGDDRDAELVRLGDADVLLLGVEDEDRLGQLLHVADALQVALELLELAPDDERFLLRHGLEVAGCAHALVLLHLLHALRDRLEVGEHAAEPALVDVGHAALLGVRPDRILRLLLRADEQDRAVVRDEIPHERIRGLDPGQRLLQIDDVDAVALAEDEPLHLRVPTAGLVTEVDSGLQQLLHGDDGRVHDVSTPLPTVGRSLRRSAASWRRASRDGATVGRRRR